MAKSSFEYIKDERIDPQTGTPAYYNMSKKANKSPFDFEDFRQRNISSTPVVENVGNMFQPYGGVRGIDESLGAADLEDIPEARAQAQSGIGLIGKALGQSINEMVLGTLESSGYLLDATGIANSIAGNEGEFDNWFSKIFRDAKESINEKYLPIYESNAAKEGALLDRTALASGAKNIATSLSLMIPALGVARGINVLGKLAGMGVTAESLGMLQLSEAVGAGLASRAAEATMEAQQYLKQYTDQNKTDLMKKYESKAMEEINNLPMVMPPNEYGFSPYSQEQRQVEEQRILDRYKSQIDVEAKNMAIDGANKVFKANGALAVIDAMQYMPIFKAFGSIYDGVKGGKMLEVGLQMGSEAGEEFYQSGSQAEAYGSIKAGVNMFGPGFSERFGEYLDSNEMKQSVFWGALGGGVFAAAAPLGKKIIDSATDISMWKDKLSRDGNVEEFTKLSNDERVDLISKHIKRNRLDKLSDELSVMEQSINAEDWQSIGTTKEQAATTIALIKDDIAFAKEEKAKLDANEKFNGREDAKLDFVKTKLTAKNNAKLIKSSTDEINSLYRDIEKDGELTIDLVTIKRLQDKISALKSLKTSLNKIPSFKKDSELKSTVAKNTDLNIAVLSEKMAQLKELYIASNPNTDFDVILKTSKDDQINNKTYAVTELNTVQNSVVKPTLAAYEKMSHIESQDSKIKEQRQKAQKEETKESVVKARTPEDISDIAESIPEENVDQVVNTTEDLADQEELDASDKPDLRYVNKPNLFIRDMNLIEGHVLSRYGGNIDEDSNSELLMITMSANADEFIKNYQSLYEVAKNDPSKMKLFATIQEFFEDIIKSSSDKIVNKETVVYDDIEIKEFSADDAELIADAKNEEEYVPEGERSPHDIMYPIRAIVPRYTMIQPVPKGPWKISYLDGSAIPEKAAFDIGIDFDYTESENNLIVGSEIYFKVDLDKTVGKNPSEYNKGLTKSNFVNAFTIQIVQKDKNGIEHVVNGLPSYRTGDKTANGLKLKELRQKIYDQVNAVNNKTGSHNTGITTKVTRRFSGNIIRTKALSGPLSTMRDGEELVFGIATNINGITTINVPNKPNDPEYHGIKVADKNNGAVFIMLRGFNGRIVPARTYTQKLTKFPELMASAVKLLKDSNKDNWVANREEIRKIVYFDYFYDVKSDTFIKPATATSEKQIITKDNISQFLTNKIVQVSSKEINKGNYNKTISNQGRLKTDLKPKGGLSNSNFEFSLDYTEKTENIIEVNINEALNTPEARAIIEDEFTSEPVVLPNVSEGVTKLPSEEVEDDFEIEQFESKKLTTKKPDDNTRLRLVDLKIFYKRWDKIKETKWFKDRFDESLIDVDRFKDGLVNIAETGGLHAWGMFKNATAYIAGAAQTGTTYHEAFHVVFHLYLNDKQRTALLKENAKLGKTDIEIEETIADKFIEYVQTEEMSKGGLGKQILDFFKQLYYMIKHSLHRDLTMDQVFFMMEHKGFRPFNPTKTIENMRVVRLSAVYDNPYEESRRTIAISDQMRKQLDLYIAQHPELANVSRKNIIASMSGKSDKGADLSGLDMLALDARHDLVELYKAETDPVRRASFKKMIVNFISQDSTGKILYSPLAKVALKQFAKFEGLRIKLSSNEIASRIDNINSEVNADFIEEEDTQEGWGIDTQSVSHKESLSNDVRKELSYIPILNADKTEKVDDLGFVIYQDFNKVFSDLQVGLADSDDSTHMMDKFAYLVQNKPYLASVYDVFNSSDNLKTSLFNSIGQLAHVNYTGIRIFDRKVTDEVSGRTENLGKESIMYSSNRSGIKNTLIDEWKENSTDPSANNLLNPDGSLNEPKALAIKKRWDNFTEKTKSAQDYTTKDIEFVFNVLNYIGISITMEDLNNINKSSINPKSNRDTPARTNFYYFKSNLDVLINKWSLGLNPFSSESGESNAINQAVGKITQYRSDMMDSSFRNGEGKAMFAHQTPTFLSRQIQQFKGSGAIDKINWYQNDPDINGPQNGTPFYNASPWLTELRNEESRENFEYTEVDSIAYGENTKGIRYKKMSKEDLENTSLYMYLNGGKTYTWYRFPVVSDAPKLEFIKFRRYTQNDVVEKMYNVFQQETARIENVKAREEARNTFMAEKISAGYSKVEALNLMPDTIKEVKNYDHEKSRRFLYLTFFNSGAPRKVVETKNPTAIKAEIKKWLDDEAKKDFARLVKMKILGKNLDGTLAHDHRINKAWGNSESFHKDYFYNTVLANTQMSALFSGDLAFYKADKDAASIYSRTVDNQKRNKQNVSPKTVLDTNAVFHLTEEQAAIEGKPSIMVKPTFNTTYISDLKTESNFKEEIYETLVENGMDESKAVEIASAYGYSRDYIKDNEGNNTRQGITIITPGVAYAKYEITPKSRTLRFYDENNNIIKDKVEHYLSSTVNVTDAQAYISITRYREIMIGLGGNRWTKQMQNLYPKALNGTLSGNELLFMMNVVKPFYYGHVKNGNLIMPTQNKNSEYVLLKQLADKSPVLSKVYNHMITKNSTVNFNSAVKAGEFGARPVEDIDNASIHVLNNADYGLQQETPEHHLDAKILIGSQIRVHAISDISPDAKFELNGQSFTRDELLDLYHKIITQDLKEAYTEVEGEFYDINHISNLLLNEIIDRDLGDDREAAVRIVKRPNRLTHEMEEQTNLPLGFPTHAMSNERLLNSVFKNRVTKQKIKGGAFAQVSAFGFSDELNLIMDGKRLVGAEVMLPWWSKKYFEPLLDADGQLDKNKVPQNLLEMIGYRIPTEDKYSMLPLIVKGFLPASAGGAVMLPMEITTISGSDFDIDKMYIMMPEWETSMDGKDVRKVEYEYNGDISSQSKQARNNAQIDIIRAILTHFDTFAKIFTPGGFPTLETLAKRVLEAEGRSDEMLSFVLPSTQTELFDRNMTGAALKGMAVSQNKNHAIVQFTQIELRDAVEFDGLKLRSLHNTMDSTGKTFVSRNTAEWVASAVDNAKNPIASVMNINTYTSGIASLMTRLGYPLETTVGFLSQPIIKEFSSRYFAYGANRQAETKAINEIMNEFKNAGLKGLKDFEITTEGLWKGISRRELLTNEQLMYFSRFNKIKKQANSLADLVRSMNADTNGAGPTLSANEKLLRLRQKVSDDISLIGVSDLFNGKVYPMESKFVDYGIQKPTDILAEHFPWFTPAWTSIKSGIASNIKSKDLTVEQIDKINFELYGYIASGFEFFNGVDRGNILNNIANEFVKLKAENPVVVEENFFLNKLKVKKDDSKPNNPKALQFKNTGSLTNDDKNEAKKAILSLLRDEKFSTFAKKLVKYSFYTAGFQITSTSFNHLIPVEFWTNLADGNGQLFIDYLGKSVENAENSSQYEEFVDKFFKNNYRNPSFVPMVDTEKWSNITGVPQEINGIPVYFEVNRTDGDFTLLTTENYTAFSPYVSLRKNGVTYLFKNLEINSHIADYVLTNKLGVSNQILEYSMNDDNSVIAGNNPFVGFTESEIIEKYVSQGEARRNEVEDAEEVEEVKEPLSETKPALEVYTEVDRANIFESNKDAILNKFPDITFEVFSTMTDQQIKKLIECL